MNKLLSLLFLALTLAVITSCEKEEPEVPNEEELITTLRYTLTPTLGGSVVVLEFKDLDGDGGDDPIITSGTLDANASYSGSIVLLNEAENPVENISLEVAEEDDEHQFFFSSTAGITVAYNDQDDDGNPLGLATTVTTGEAGSGELTVILRHEPDKNASGVNEGKIDNAGGETDIEVSFPVTIQ